MDAMIGREEYLHFCDHALDQMAGIVADLGDDLATRTPGLPGANSPYALLTHCLGVVEFWVGHVVLGRDSHRDRDAEFSATGPVEPLLEQSRETRHRLAKDLRDLDPDAPVRNPSPGRPESQPMSRAYALQHLYTELAQHLGQLEITRDLLLAGAAA